MHRDPGGNMSNTFRGKKKSSQATTIPPTQNALCRNALKKSCQIKEVMAVELNFQGKSRISSIKENFQLPQKIKLIFRDSGCVCVWGGVSLFVIWSQWNFPPKYFNPKILLMTLPKTGKMKTKYILNLIKIWYIGNYKRVYTICSFYNSYNCSCYTVLTVNIFYKISCTSCSQSKYIMGI